MRPLRSLPWLIVLGLLPSPLLARSWDAPGSLVSVSVDVDGRHTPLYPAPDGSGRFYLEARAGSRYVVNLANRSGERMGVVLTVDGLNAISGERDPGAPRTPWSRPGRMYVLDPWDTTTVRGWRTSLDEVRRFTFVDERSSYAARSGKANGKMGWIEVTVYRERRPSVWRRWFDDGGRRGRDDDEARARDRAEAPPPAAARPAPEEGAPEAKSHDSEGSRAFGYGERPTPTAPPGSYPGTGWGPRADDPVVVVDFEPEARPAERLTLRYEYASALRALGILPRHWPQRDRLSDRERGIDGFTQPPAW